MLAGLALMLKSTTFTVICTEWVRVPSVLDTDTVKVCAGVLGVVETVRVKLWIAVPVMVTVFWAGLSEGPLGGTVDVTVMVPAYPF
jgi:hypothetical protein